MKIKKTTPQRKSAIAVSSRIKPDKSYSSLEKCRELAENLSRQLIERKKELECHRRFSEILILPWQNLDEFCNAAVNLIPPAFQFPEKLSAMIEVRGKKFKTRGFRISDHKLISKSKKREFPSVTITVCYRVSKKFNPSPLFLKEEKELLNQISLRVANYADKLDKLILLSESEKEHLTILNSISDVIYGLSLEGYITYVSPGIKKITGYSVKEISGRHFLDLITDEEKPGIAAVFKNTDKNKPLTLEFPILHKNKTTRWLRATTSPVFQNKKVISGTGTLIDITDSKLSALELLKAESLYSSLLEASPDVVTITDMEGKIVYSSRKSTKMFGAKNEKEYINHSLLEFIHPDFHSKAINGIKRMLSGDFPGAEEYLGISRDGRTFDIEVNGEFIRDQFGNPVNMLFVTRDISVRKMLERTALETARLNSSVIEASADGIAIHDLNGVISYASPRFAEMFGAEDAKDLIGRKMREFAHQKEYDWMMNKFDESLRAGKFPRLEVTGLKIDGSPFDLEVTASLILDESGQPEKVISVGRDITERKRLEKEALANEKKYREIIETLRETIYEITPEGNISFISPSVTTILGYLPEELHGCNFTELVHKDDLSFVISTLQNISKQTYPSIEYRIRCKDGNYKWVRVSANRVYENERIVSIRGSLSDITELALAEEKKKEAEQNYLGVISSAPVGIVVLNEFEQSVFANEEFTKMTGYLADEIQDSSRWFERVYPDAAYREHIRQSWYAEIQRSIAEKTRFNPIQARITCKDGIECYMEVSFAQINKMSVVTFVDVNQRQEAENRLRTSEENYRSLVESVNDVLYEVDNSGVIKYVSPVIVNILGYTDSELTGTNFLSYLHPDEIPLLITSIEKLSKTDNYTGASLEYRFYHKDGHIKWVSCSPSPVFKDGVLTGHRGILTDIDERRKAVEQLKEQTLYTESILSALHDMIFIIHSDGRIIDFIAPFEEALMLPPEEFLNRSLKEIFPPELTATFLTAIEDTLNGIVTDPVEYQLTIAGEERYFEAKFTNLSGEKVIAKVSDTTWRKKNELRLRESESRFRMLFDNMPQGVIYENSSCQIINANPAACRILGFSLEQMRSMKESPWDEVLNEDGTFFPPELFPERQVLATLKPVHDVVIGLNKRDAAGPIWLLLNAEPELDPITGSLSGIFVTYTDITAQKNNAKEILWQTRLKDLLMNISNTYINLPHDKLDLTINNSLKELGEFISADRFYIFDYNLEAYTTTNTYEWCAEGVEPQIEYLKDYPLDGLGDWITAHTAGKEFLIPNVQELPEGSALRETLEPQGIKSILTVPMMDGSKCIGFAGFDAVSDYHHFSPGENELLTVFCNMLVSVRKRFETESVIAESELRFRRLYENMAQGVVYQNADGYITSANPAAERLLGLSLDQMQGRTSAHPGWRAMKEDGSDFPGDQHPAMVALRTGQTIKSVVMGVYNPVIDKQVWIIVSAEPEFRQGEEKPYRVFATFTDITENKAAAMQLEENRRFLSDIIENSGSLIYVKDINGRYVSVNRKYEEVTGLKREDVLGRTDGEIFPDTVAGRSSENDKMVFSEMRSLSFEEILDTPTESKYFIAIKFPMVDNNGEVSGICGMSTEITETKLAEKELRESEARLSNLVNSQTNYVIRTDLNGELTYWNEKYLADFGWLYQDGKMDKAGSLRSICEYHHQRTYETVEKCILNPGTIFKVELDKPLKVGGVCTTLWEFVCLPDSQGNPSEIQCMGTDITYLKKAEVELRLSNERSLTIMNAIESFIYIADMETHELLFVNEYGKKTWGSSITGQKCFRALQGKEQPCEFCTNPILVDSEGNPTEGHRWEFQNILNQRWYSILDKAIRWSDGRLVRMEIATDITEQKLADIKIRESEEKYRSLIDSSDAVIWMTDREGKLLYLNSRAAANLGHTPEEMTGINLSEFFSEEESSGLMKDIREVIDDNKGKVREAEVIIKGTPGYFRTSIQPVRNEAGNPYAVMLYTTDITAPKTAELKIKQSEEKYRILFFDSPDGYLLLDNGKFIECNRASESLMRCTREQLLNLAPAQISPEFQPNGKLSTDYAQELISETYQKGRNTFEWIHTRFDGTEFFALVSTSVIDYEGRKVLFINWKDITEKKQAEEEIRKFRTIADRANIGNVISDIEGNLLYVNEYFAKMHGYTPEELVGQHLLTCHTPDQSEKALEAFRFLMENKQFNNFEVWQAKKDGKTFPTLMNAMIINDEEGNPQFIYSTSIDITERKQAEEELRKFRTISDNANYGNSIAALDGTLLYVNDYLAKMHGYEVHELIGKNLSILHPEEYLSGITEALDHLKTHGSFESFEIPHIRKDGTIFPTLMNAVIIKDDQNRPQFMSSTAVDITEQKRADELLRNSEELLNQAQQIAKMGSWVMDVKTGKTKWSKNYFEIVGMKPTQDLQMAEDLRSFVHPDDLHIFQKKLSELVPGAEMDSFDFRMITSAGETKWMQAIIVPTFENGTLKELSGVSIDITERKKYEREIKKLTLAIEQSPVSLVITDLNSVIQYISPSFTKVTGYTAEDAIGKKISILKSGMTDDNVYKELWETISEGRIWHGELMNRKKSGELFWENISITPVLDDSGKVSLYLAIREDISLRKAAEKEISDLNANLEIRIAERTKELEQKNEEIETFFAVTIDLLSISDLDGNILKLNQAWEDLLGYKVEEIREKKFDEFIHPDDLQLSHSMLEKIVSGAPSVEFVGRYHTKHADVKFIEWHSVKSGDQIYSAARDVTERVFSEKSISIQRDLATRLNAISDLGTALDHILEAVLEFDPVDGGGIYFINNSTGNLELIAHSGLTDDFLSDKSSYAPDTTQYQIVMDGKPVYAKYSQILPEESKFSGTDNLLGLAIIPLTHEGRSIGVMNLASKTTENFPERIREALETIILQISVAISRILAENALLSSQRNFKMLFNTIDDFLFILDKNGNIVLTNPIVIDRLGYSEEELSKMHVLSVHPELRRDEAGFIVQEMLAGRASYCPVPLCTKDKVEIPVETRVVLGEWDGKPALFGISRDMTERKKYEDQLLSARNEAEKANMAKSEFLSRMSHELRTPMNSILGFAQLLEMGTLPTPQRKSVGHILRSGQHLLELINEVLEISKIEAGKLTISIEPVEVTGLIKEMIDSVAPLAIQKQVTIELMETSEFKKYVKADRQRLKQIVLNLLNNAIKYNIEGGLVKIQLAEMPTGNDGNDTLRVSLMDSGIGIASADLEKIFTPFERIGAEKGDTEGTGLGLAVVKKLVELMEGSIGVSSAEGAGSTFWFELPLTESDIARFEKAGELVASATGSVVKQGTIFYIEDNASNIELVEQILAHSRPGIRLITSLTGRGAAKFAREIKPDLILLDLNLPDINGADVLSEIKSFEETTDIPVVIITADATPRQSERLLNAGALEYITKPLNIDHFLSIVDNILK